MEFKAEKAEVRLEFDLESDPRRAMYASHFRAGEWAEARQLALEGHAAASDPDELLAWSSNLGNVERKDGNPQHALTIHKLAAPLLHEARNPLVIAKYHHSLANTHLDQFPTFFAQSVQRLLRVEELHEYDPVFPLLNGHLLRPPSDDKRQEIRETL